MSAAFIECVGVGVQEFILSYNRHQAEQLRGPGSDQGAAFDIRRPAISPNFGGVVNG